MTRFTVVLQQAQKRGSWQVPVDAPTAQAAGEQALRGRPQGTRVVAVKRPRLKRGER